MEKYLGLQFGKKEKFESGGWENVPGQTVVPLSGHGHAEEGAGRLLYCDPE